jgi:aryl-alcohol dehydrogenase-like predicted oxidoreductase
VETWDAFLELQREGVVKSIGVSRLAMAEAVASAANVGFCEGKWGFQPCFPWNMMV